MGAALPTDTMSDVSAPAPCWSVTVSRTGQRPGSLKTCSAVAPVADEREAIRLANQSRFGLGAAVFTRDLDRAERIGHQLEAGVIAVNGMVRSDPRMPFGGVKESGWGRELSCFGIREFVNVKSVKIAAAPA